VNIATPPLQALLARLPIAVARWSSFERASYLQVEVAALRELSKVLADKLQEQAREHQQALEFKDVLIREVHHRVKNSMQMAASLLSMHARATPSEQVRCSLQASCGRLGLLARVHELLYVSAGDTQEVLLPTLLQALGDALRESFAEMSERVRLRITSDPVELHTEQAIPLAMVANELIMNAYKHAFPPGCVGEIAVELGWTAEQVLALHVRDNGVGMRPEGGDRGLGLRLIRAFAAQLRGTLAFSESIDAQGTAVTLTFPCGGQR
jgi:two-component sensor histidine kinase